MKFKVNKAEQDEIRAEYLISESDEFYTDCPLEYQRNQGNTKPNNNVRIGDRVMIVALSWEDLDLTNLKLGDTGTVTTVWKNKYALVKLDRKIKHINAMDNGETDTYFFRLSALGSIEPKDDTDAR